MKSVGLLTTAWVLIVAFGSTPLGAQTPLDAEITYSRSNMKINGAKLNGAWDMRFKLWDAATGGNQVGPTLTKTGVNISNGNLPKQVLDFGSGIFDGSELWIETRARQGGAPYKSVGSRQQFRAVPYALALPGLFTIPNDQGTIVVAGYSGNVVSDAAVGSIVNGGIAAHPHEVTGVFCTISGGCGNKALSNFATVTGGYGNTASGIGSTAAGAQNDASGYMTVAFGNVCSASGEYATAGGGNENAAFGNYSTVPGGRLNSANGNYSFAAGRRAQANSDGAFVWADSTDANFNSNGVNTMTVRASGGVYLYTAANLSSGVFVLPGSGSWASVSDRNVKSNILPVNSKAVLDKLIAMPISTWSYNSQDDCIRHMGPMAQDFKAAFGMGQDERMIETIDADGVALAAIQGLHQLVQEKDARIESLEEQLARMAKNNDEIVQRLARLEAMGELSSTTSSNPPLQKEKSK